jgi:hypothetical protein
MALSPQKAISTEVHAEETQLPAPRFDEAATHMARPVVPLTHTDAFPHPGWSNLRSQLTISRKGSWLLGILVGFILAAGAMGLGVSAYRRNQVISTQSLATATDATRIEITEGLRPGRSSRSSEPPAAAPPAVSKPAKRIRRSTSNVPDGSPKPRLVDRYVLP